MTTENESNLEQLKQDLKKYFIEQIAITQAKQNDFKVRMDNSAEDQVVSLKNFYALASIVHSQHADTLSMLAGLSEEAIDFNVEAQQNFANLEKTIQTFNEITGVDVSNIKNALEKLRITLDKPKTQALERFQALIKNTSPNNENKKQTTDDYVK